MKKNFIVSVVIIAVIAAAIAISSSQIDKPMGEKNTIKLTPMAASKDYPDAELKLVSYTNEISQVPGSDTFNFEVKNFQLGAQTPDAAQKMCANSAKGQHIHFILDNAPYAASYSDKVPANVGPGRHVLLAFLSRSYHESLKHPKSYIIKEFDAGTGGPDRFDEKAPHLFFSRPKGEYIGEQEIKKVMLDFYLINCNLSETGYKVKATINGQEFTISKWQPYAIEGLPLGESKIKLELMDKTGKLVNSPYNGTERTITLKTEPTKD